jgi:hypothetical protein
VIYGEHLCAEEVLLKCACGVTATVEVVNKSGRSHGWFCRRHGHKIRGELRKQEKIARAIVTKGVPR